MEKFDVNENYGFEEKKAENWLNKQRTLVTCSRGILSHQRELMMNLWSFLPHSKKDAKLEKAEVVEQLEELCESRDCSNLLYFQARGKSLYLWSCKYPDGPSVYYQLHNVVAAEDYRFMGNCLKGSRAFLSFDVSFKAKPHMELIKNMLVDTFNVPKHHPKSMPFFDKVFSFNHIEETGTVCFRHYQINKTGSKVEDVELIEIGPRFDMQLVKIFDGFMGGKVLYSNEAYETPRTLRVKEKQIITKKRIKKMNAKKEKEDRTKSNLKYEDDDSLDEFLG